MTERSIRDFHGNDVWRDDEGTIWVRQIQLVELAQFYIDRVAAYRATTGELAEHAEFLSSVAVLDIDEAQKVLANCARALREVNA